MNRKEQDENILRLMTKVSALENRACLLEFEAAERGIPKFLNRTQLEAIARNQDPCPACGHRRSEDG